MSGGFPRRFGSYVLLKPLARGGMGELFLAATGGRGMEKLCVVKKVLPHLLAGDTVRRFREEAMVVVRLSHGNLVGVLDAGRTDDGGDLYLAMDFVEGKDLLATWNRCALQRMAFPLEIAAYIIKELARGLAYAHSYRDLGLVHRDISPANVILSYSGEVKLTDFGLAISKLKVQRTAPGVVYGKLAYLAPEQARGQPLDGRADLYAAGILLWELLTGQQLFPVGRGIAGRGDSSLDALQRMKNPQVPPPSAVARRVPAELDAVVMKALAVEREARYQNGEELRADLASFLARHAPATDAATLATLMTTLFGAQIAREHLEQGELLAAAATMMPAMASSPFTAATALPPPGSESVAAATAMATATEATATTTAALPATSTSSGPADSRASTRVAGRSSAARQRPAPASRTAARDGSSDDHRIDTTIGGRYFVRRLCGQGAMGRVYEGQHVEIGRRVAIKILHPTYGNTADVVERFRREARAASKIGHPNIVDVTDSGTTADGAFFFVMEYLDGVNLEQLIDREGMLPVERALLIAAQICRALVAAHAAGIIHRDLKPANVMLVNRRDDEDFVKVLDFGISKHSDLDAGPHGRDAGLTRPDAAVGTPVYMSPEQVAGAPADARTDVYAVGELVYEMLTGVPPCDADDVIAVFNKKATEDPRPMRSLRSDVPADIERVVVRALSRRAADRQPSMAALKDDILACLGAIQKTPRPAGGPRHSQTGATVTERLRRLRRPRVLIAAGAGAALVLAGALGISSLLGGRQDGRGRPQPAVAERPAAPAAAPGSEAIAGRPSPAPSPAPAAAPLPAATPPDAVPQTIAVRSPDPRLHMAAPTWPEEDHRNLRPVPGTVPLTRGFNGPGTVHPATGGGRPQLVGAPRGLGANLPARLMRRISPPRARDPSAAAAAAATTEPPAPTPPRPQAAPPPPRPAAGTPSAEAAELLARGRGAFAKGAFPEAVRLGRQTVAAGDPAGGHLLLGDAFYKMDRFPDALREYGAVLEIAPDNAAARRGLDLAAARIPR